MVTSSCIPGSDSYNDGPSNLEVNDVFKDNMVLQRGTDIRVFGNAYKTTKIKVEFNGSSRSTIAEKKGGWEVNLPKQKDGGPYELKIIANDTTIVFKDVFVKSDVDITSLK